MARASLESGWTDYLRDQAPRGATVENLAELRRAFFGGAEHLFRLVADELEEAQRRSTLRAIKHELVAHTQSLRAASMRGKDGAS